jgi:sortase A
MGVVVRKAISVALLVAGIILLLGTLGGIGDDSGTAQRRNDLLNEYNEQIVKVPGNIEKPHVASNKDAAVLRIPELGNKWVYPIVDGVGEDVLDSGVLGRFPESTVPGGEGNYSLTAHRITHGEPFRNLPDVDKGDVVYLDSAGYRYTYRVTKMWSVNYRNVGVLRPVGNQKLITLITCDSLAPTDDRYIVRGILISEEQL